MSYPIPIPYFILSRQIFTAFKEKKERFVMKRKIKIELKVETSYYYY
jgi:hypothetical protein